MPVTHVSSKDAANLTKAVKQAMKWVEENPGKSSIGAALAKILSDWGIVFYQKNHKHEVPAGHHYHEH